MSAIICRLTFRRTATDQLSFNRHARYQVNSQRVAHQVGKPTVIALLRLTSAPGSHEPVLKATPDGEPGTLGGRATTIRL